MVLRIKKLNTVEKICTGTVLYRTVRYGTDSRENLDCIGTVTLIIPGRIYMYASTVPVPTGADGHPPAHGRIVVAQSGQRKLIRPNHFWKNENFNMSRPIRTVRIQRLLKVNFRNNVDWQTSNKGNRRTVRYDTLLGRSLSSKFVQYGTYGTISTNLVKSEIKS